MLGDSVRVIKNFFGRIAESARLPFMPYVVGRFSGAEMIDRHWAADKFSGAGCFYSFGETFLHIFIKY
jgi:hypothetical protein